MKKTVIILSVFALLAGGCKQKNNENLQATIKQVLIDYKSDTYRISLGESYEISKKLIDWRYDFEENRDTTDKVAFLFLGEPLITYNNTEWLPALFIETNKNIITSFTCSISFTLDESENSIKDFLNIISKDIKRLQIDTVKKSIISDGIFEISAENYIETYKLTKRNGSAYDNFRYTIKTNTPFQK